MVAFSVWQATSVCVFFCCCWLSYIEESKAHAGEWEMNNKSAGKREKERDRERERENARARACVNKERGKDEKPARSA